MKTLFGLVFEVEMFGQEGGVREKPTTLLRLVI